MKVLVACEFSGVVREAFRRRGHDAWSVDLLPTEQPGNHIVRDALDAIATVRPELLIAHPPCTYLCNSGVRWLAGNDERQRAMEESCRFFSALLHADVPMVAVENPIPHGYALRLVGERYTQIIHPWQFGHGETKATCLWLRNLPKLTPTQIVEGRTGRVHHESPGPDRWKNRSRTLTGIAEAMAEQWGVCFAEAAYA